MRRAPIEVLSAAALATGILAVAALVVATGLLAPGSGIRGTLSVPSHGRQPGPVTSEEPPSDTEDPGEATPRDAGPEEPDEVPDESLGVLIAEPEESPPRPVRGTVVDVQGRPVVDAIAEVRKYEDPSEGEPPVDRTLRSDANGEFRVELAANEVLRVGAPGLARLEWSGGVEPEESQDEPEAVVLFVLRPARTVEGLVVDDRGAPIDEATVAIVADLVEDGPSSVPVEARSDREGRFALSDVPRCPLGVSAQHEGHASETRALIPGQMDQLRFTLPRLARLVVRVLGNGEPIESPVTITALGAGGHRSASDGFFSEELRPGPTRIRIDAQDYLPAEWTLDLVPGEVREETVELDPGLAVRGRLVDDRGNPVPDAAVILEAPRVRHADTDDTGGFVWKAVVPGSYPVRVHQEGLGALDVQPEEIDLRDGLDEVLLRIPSTAIASVTIVFLDDLGREVPFERGDVQVEGEHDHCLCLRKGEYRHRLVLPAKRCWVFGSAGDCVYSSRFTPDPGRPEQVVEVRPLPPSTISGTVRDASSRPVAGARVAFQWSPGACEMASETTESDATGAFRLEGIRASGGWLTCSVGARRAAEERIDLAPGENRVDLILEGSGPVGPVDVLVLDPEGLPLEGVEVSFEEWDVYSGPSTLVRTGPDGRVRVESVGPGPQRLLLWLLGTPLRVKAPPEASLTVRFPPIVVVSGTIPMSGTLYVRREGEDLEPLEYPDGAWTIRLPAGRYGMVGVGADFVSAVVEIHARSDLGGVALEAGPSGIVRGTVPPGAAPPRSDLPVRFRVPSGPFAGLTLEGSLRSGNFVSPALPVGPIEIECGGKEHGVALRGRAEVRAGETVDAGELSGASPVP